MVRKNKIDPFQNALPRKHTLDFEKMDKFLADTAIAHKIFMRRIEEIRKSQLAIRQAKKTGDVSFIK